MKKTPAIYIVLFCAIAFLCGCANSSPIPIESVSQSESMETSSSAVSETTNPVSTMQQMKLSEMEQFYLSAFSDSEDQNAVYEIQLTDGDTYTGFTATVYEFQDGSWKKRNGLRADIEDSVSFFAVDYYDLSLPSLKFKSGSTCHGSRTSSSDVQSLFTEGYSWDTDVKKSITITDEEVPLIAYRRSAIGGEEKKAALRDFFSPETIPADEVEEYYLLTIQFTE